MFITMAFCSVLWMLATITYAAYNPTVRVVSCTKSVLVVKVTGAADNGLIYIQGQGESCKQLTSSSREFYEFDFATCNIQWEMIFKVVLQQMQHLQTGDDQVVPVMCVVDTSDIVIGNFVATGDKNDDESLNKTVKPEASMSFFKIITEENVSGKEVKLSDRLIIIIQLQNEYINDFDIQAKSCSASGILLIEDFCAVNVELFGNFWKTKQGNILGEFGAFRTTSYDDDTVMMNFTCTLQLCKGYCQPEKCPDDTYSGWGRKRRSAAKNVLNEIALNINPNKVGVKRRRRQIEIKGETIDVGGAIEVVKEYSKIRIMTNDEICWDKTALFITIAFLSVGILALSATCVILYRKLRIRQSCCQKLDGSVTYPSSSLMTTVSAAALTKK